MRWCTAGHHAVEPLVVGAVADGGGVVDERVVPDVEDVAGRPTGRGTPQSIDVRVIEKSLQALADEAEGLVALALGLRRRRGRPRTSRAGGCSKRQSWKK